ncbi:MAG: family 1 glycosylhydrolase [Firmicutes bacterium]|nr:family 1 glycosylhydrolase [Bacillota bacterium]
MSTQSPFPRKSLLELGPEPEDFRWATGIEDTFVAETWPGRRRLDLYELQQHYRFWREDLDLAAETGVTMMRYGIPWYKVNPAPGVFDWSWTDQVLEYMVREKKIEPIIDLVHYGTPLWLENAFLHPRYPEYVAAYAQAVAERYRPLGVRYFTPLNEPLVTALFCGEIRRWPPYLQGHSGFVAIALQCARGVIRTVQAIRAVHPEAVFVHVEASTYHFSREPELAAQCRFIMDRHQTLFELVQGRVVPGHFLYDYLRANGLTPADEAWFWDNAIPIDVVGLNFYPEMSVTELYTGPDGTVRRRNVVQPGRLKDLARDWYARHRRPIFITETSTNQKSHDRLTYLEESVAAVRELRAEGIPVIGYTWWPLYDLVNWDYREGTEPVAHYLEPMGLYALVPDPDGTLRRRPLPVAERFRQMVAETPARVGRIGG